MAHSVLGPAALILAWLAPAHAAEQFESHYTAATMKSCRTIARAKPGDGDWITLSCPGRAGLVVWHAESDLRQTISVGRTLAEAEKEPAAKTWFGPFNFVGERIEWRSVRGTKTPFAIIQRWFVSDTSRPGKDGAPTSYGFLVVTRLPPGPVCHVAYVDVRANAEPNTLARKTADEQARTFRCGTDQVRIPGKRGRAIELIQP